MAITVGYKDYIGVANQVGEKITITEKDREALFK